MLRTKKLTDINGKDVYTDSGDYFGEVEESILSQSKVFGWKIRATKGSYLNKMFGGAKGVIVPHQLVRSIGDIIIISKAGIQTPEEPVTQDIQVE
ncbi:MAG: PRC-barrel domain-containing protein [Candidatus Woesearchaeota archaeon]